MPDIGYDCFITAPGENEEMTCRVCGAECDVRRNVYGATSWATAVAQRPSEHDYFFCPHSEESWHKQALELVHAIEEMPSKRVIRLMRMDLEDILEDHIES